MAKRILRSVALVALIGAVTGVTAPAPAEATLMYPDVVISYFPSIGGGLPSQPYGGTYPGGVGFPVSLSSLCVVLGPEPGCLATPGNVDFLSLPIGAGVAVGFLDESIYDGPGSDFGVFETVPGDLESANVYVSTNFGLSYTFVGGGLGSMDFDLASLGLGGIGVNAVMVIGTGNGGASPGYDLERIQAYNIPEPGTLTLIGLGLAGLAARRGRRA